jgi:hypothetical protein
MARWCALIRGGEVLIAHHLPADLGQHMAEAMAAHGLQPIAQHSDERGERLVVAPRPARVPWADHYLASFRDQVVEVALKHVCAGRPDPLRVVTFGPLRRLRRTARALADLFPVAESIVVGAPGGGPVIGTQVLGQGGYGTAELTVFAPGTSKGAAFTHLAKLLEVPLAETLAIGDGLNDLSLLQVAGLAVAMGNAPTVLRRVALAVTGSNDEDGAAQAIERYVLGWPESEPALALPATARGQQVPAPVPHTRDA